MDIFTAHHDTICAVATPIGEGGIGILRISGPDALNILERVFRPQRKQGALQSHRLYYGWIIDPISGERVDEVLASWMRGPQTYTREDVVEINSHSGFGVLDRLLRIVLASGARLAEPGEFTRRAFLSGRIDLSQAEAVIELIRSRSEESLRQAGRQLRGGLRTIVEDVRDRLLSLQARLEAFIDFADEMEGDESREPQAVIEGLHRDVLSPLHDLRNRYNEARVLREGLTVVLAGKPNVGKSSLLNRLVGRDRAIVTPHPGTTRDVIEDVFILSGVTIRVLDTAGLRPQGDLIETLGMAKTRESLSEADVVLWMLDQSRPLDEEDDSVFESISNHSPILILNKADLPACFSVSDVTERYQFAAPALALSVLSHDDLEILRATLKERFLDQPLHTASSGGIVPNLRQKQCLDRALESLGRAISLFHAQTFGELVSLELDQARRELETILGLQWDDALLDRIFGNFCIGK